jgi:NAD(P)-dependent dehydrogenase (short-subunit alcohol dehydrogenase family)
MSQVWLITGSSRGLGRAFAEAVLASGFQVAATARNTEDLAELTDKYGDLGPAVRASAAIWQPSVSISPTNSKKPVWSCHQAKDI